MEIKGLLEKLNLDPSQVDSLRRKRVENGLRQAQCYLLIQSRGGNIHGVNRAATAKRRARNKVARAQRRRNRTR